MENNDKPPPLAAMLKVDEDLKLDLGQGREGNDENMLRQAIVELVGNTTQTVVYDIQKVTTFPELRAFALFASNAYENTEKEMLPLPNGWKLIATAVNASWTNGYFGAAFMHPEQLQVVIAHRGTATIGALVADVQGVINNHMTQQMHSACTFSNKICSILMDIGKQRNIRFQIFFTGHSLGGWLAQITTFCVKYLDIRDSDFQLAKSPQASVHAHTVAFDSPGCQQMLSKMLDTFDIRYDGRTISMKELDISTFLSAPNLINTLNRHAGALYRLEVDFSGMTWLDKHTTIYTKAVHSMQGIVKALEPNDELNILVVADWPSITLSSYSKNAIKHLLKNALGTTQFHNEDEWNDFFKLAKHEDNYIPKNEMKDGYCLIRYQTRAADKQRCNINVFKPTEKEFLNGYHTLKRFGAIDTLFANVPSKVDQELIEGSLKHFTIAKNYIIDDNLHSLIPFVQQLLHRHSDVLGAIKDAMSEYGMQRKILNDESSRFLKSVESFHLQYNENNRLTFNSHQVLHVGAKDMRIMTAKICFYYVNYTANQTECKVLKLKQLLYMNQRGTKIQDFVGAQQMTKHLFIIECRLKNDQDEEACQLLRSIARILVAKKEVRFIFITMESDKISEFITEEFKPMLGDAFHTLEDIETVWEDLSESSQNELWNRQFIYFNGEDKISLSNFVDLPMKKFCKLIDRETLNRLIKGEEITVGMEPQRFREFQEIFPLNDEVIQRDSLVQTILNSNEETHFMISCSIHDQNKLLNDLKESTNAKALKKRILFPTQDTDDNVEAWKKLCCIHYSKTIHWVVLTSQKIFCKRIYNPSYIKRQFTLFEFNKIFKTICNDLKLDFVFMISHSTPDTDAGTTMKQQFKKYLVFVLPESQAERHFYNLGRYVNSVHWLKVHETQNETQNIIWHRSSGSLDALQKCHYKQEYTTVPGLDEESLINLQDQVVIIAGEPGTGKSTTLMHLAEQVKSHWVIHTDLRFCGHAFESITPTTEINEDNAVIFLSMVSGLDKDFDKTLLKCGLKYMTKRRLYLLFDGFDEINEIEGETFVKLLKFLKDDCKCYIWVTTRNCSREYLESRLSVIAKDLVEIGREEQREFLEKFWKVNLAFKLDKTGQIGKKLSSNAKKVLDRTDAILSPEKPNLTSVPLQLRMIAETFLSTQEQLQNVDSDDFHIKDKVDLYESFINRKYDIYFTQKLGIVSSNVPKQLFLEHLTKKHCILAYKILFPNLANNHICNFTEKACKKDVNLLNLVGLIQSKHSDEKYVFIHRIFTEYFAAKLLETSLSKPHCRHEPVETFLMSPIWNETECKAIRSLLNEMLRKISLRMDDFITSCKTNLETLFSQNEKDHIVNNFSSVLCVAIEENLGTVINISLACFQTHQKELESLMLWLNRDRKTALYIALENKNVEIAKKFLEIVGKCSNTVQQELLWGVFFRTINKTDPVIDDAMEMLECTTEMKNILKEIKDKRTRIPLFMKAAGCGILTDMAKQLNSGVKKDAIFRKYLIASTNRNNKTALHCASEKGNLELVRWLLNEGANVNARNLKDLTPLHMAAKGHHQETAVLLVESNAEINARDKSGRTALELTDNREIRKVLLNNGAVEKSTQHDVIELDLLFHEHIPQTIDEQQREENYPIIPNAKDGHQVVNDSNMPNDNGNDHDKDLLALAAEICHWQLVTHMIKQGADIKSLSASDLTNLLNYCKSLYFRGALFPRKAQVYVIRGGLILAQLRPLNLVFSWFEIINLDF